MEKPEFPCLQGDTATGVLIIGGGLTGVLCAYQLQQAGVDYTLIEAKEIGMGITQNTTAKVTVQHGLIYSTILEKYGVEGARQYYNANAKALETYRELAGTLDFGFEEKDAYVYTTGEVAPLQKELRAYRALKIPVDFVKDSPLPLPVTGAIRLKGQGQIHPLKFIYQIAKGLHIKEDTKLLELAPGVAVTNRGKIRFQKAIVATHFPLLNKHGLYFMKLYQHRSYVIALEQAQQVEGMLIDGDKQGFSFRNYGDLLLLGGGSHRTGKQGGGYNTLLAFAKEHYPRACVKYQWATQDCMSLDGIPYIGTYSKNTPDLLVATGYNKWGFTSAMAASQLLRDAVLGKANPNGGIFSPSRSILHGQLALNGLESVVNLLTPTRPRCPHLGCALKYNKQEHSWDCPCHGSRFTQDGQVIDNPATDDIE